MIINPRYYDTLVLKIWNVNNDINLLKRIMVEGEISGRKLRSWDTASELFMDVQSKHLHIIVWSMSEALWLA
jgi:hypothetical protein